MTNSKIYSPSILPKAVYEPVRVEVKAVETAQVMCASGWSNGGYAPDLGGTNNVGEY